MSSGMSPGGSEFHIQTQRKLNWCWAAVASTISEYFFPEDSMSQCQIASQVIGTSGLNCCNPGQTNSCDQQEALEDALAQVNSAGGGGMHNSKLDNRVLSFDCIRQQIDAGLPVCVRVEWRDGGGHFVIITGYSLSESETQWVDVSDPYFEDSTVPYEEFLTAYLEEGSWSDTYLVNQPAAGPICQ